MLLHGLILYFLVIIGLLQFLQQKCRLVPRYGWLQKTDQRKINIHLTPMSTLKTNKIILSTAAAIALACGTPSTWAQTAAAVPAQSASKAGIVKIIAGDVRVRDAQGERTLKSGDAVFASDRLMSGKEDSVSVVLRDGTTLTPESPR